MDKIRLFRETLLEWARNNLINYPWRKKRNPYRVLIAEILLHRTRAEQIIAPYTSLLAECPDMYSLARTDIRKLHDLLGSLGLRWRVDLLHAMAQDIVGKLDGNIPEDKESLMKLPGVSHYIASAVRCFAYGYPDPILDTNTLRVVGRVFGVAITDSSRRSKKMMEFMETIIDKEEPDLFNYGLLDFGKMICMKRKPACEKCPMSFCQFGKSRHSRGVVV